MEDPIDDLKEIRKIMENSTKFISLSGFSGVIAGVLALIGAFVAKGLIEDFSKKYIFYELQGRLEDGIWELEKKLFLVAGLVLFLAIGFGILFTYLKARKNNQRIFSALGVRLVFSLFIPLLFGGVFCIGLYLNGYVFLIAPAMLIFYGMSLLNASKFVHTEIKYLAIIQMALGVASMFYLGKGLYFWAIGFGVLHIFYGTIMYFKYDYKK